MGSFLTTAPEKQELSSQQPLQVSTEPPQQLELIPAIKGKANQKKFQFLKIYS